MMYDYVIVGGGPTGITLATMLANTKHKTLLLESEHSLGGNWKIDWDQNTNQYMTEHSPKVLFSSNHYFFQLLNQIGATSHNNTHNIYGKFGNLNIVKSFLKHMSFMDTLKLTSVIMSYFLNPNGFKYYQSIKKWAHENHISEKGIGFLKVMAIISSNTYDKVCMGAFIEFAVIDPGIFFDLVYLNRPNDWIKQAYRYIFSHDNMNIILRTKITSIDDVQGIVRDESGNTYMGKNIILATPLQACYEIIQRSSRDLKSNWFKSMNSFKRFVDKSTYIGLGFQLHFTEKVTIPSEWCWSCFNDWTVIILEKSIEQDMLSRDPKVKCVWSCVVVDLDTKSKRINKTANECDTMDEIIEESIDQINKQRQIPIPKPYKTTYHHNIVRKNNKWDTINSSYANAVGRVPYQGKKVKNVFMVGPHNLGSLTTIEHAIKSAVIFGNNKRLNHIFKVRSYTLLFVFLSIIMAYISVYLVAHKM
uniref:Amine oxidase domain-containing protein n=1 Tax=viral metagenome TaxID=1070528 RepID=A0A6C0CV57_9ZZZZ